MRRILFRWRGVTVWSYPVLLYFGLLAAVTAGNLAAHATRLDPRRVFLATLILIAPALAGARLLYVALRWKHYRRNPRRIWDRREGGMTMYGGLPAVLVLSVPLLAALELPFGAFWDVAAFSILAGMIFAKIGCFLNGCCAGRAMSGRFAAWLPDWRGRLERRAPAQCLEAAWAALLLAFATAALGRLPFEGALFLCVAALYGAGRLGLERLREPEPGAGRISPACAFSAATALGAVAILAVRWPA